MFVRVGDGEGVDRRQEEEIVAQRRSNAREQAKATSPKRTATPTTAVRKTRSTFSTPIQGLTSSRAAERDGDTPAEPTA